MNVVVHPMDDHMTIHREATLEPAPSDMQSWGWTIQLPPSTSLSHRCDWCSEISGLTASRAPHRQSLRAYPFLSLQDGGNRGLEMGWPTDSCNRNEIQVVNDLPQWQTLKRFAEEIIAPRRRLKRQRVAVAISDRWKGFDNEHSDSRRTTSPRSLQFALPNLTSHDTLCVLHAMHTVPSELRHLNRQASRNRLRRRCEVREVFGWRHLLCQEEEHGPRARRVVWKSAKALDSMTMRPLARQIWRASTESSSGVHNRDTATVLYTVNRIARVIHSPKKQYGSGNRHCARHQVWLECYLDDGLQICVARKELRQFSDYCAPETSAAECEGFLVRPVYARTINAQLIGCSLHCLRAVDACDSGVWSAFALKQQLIHDLPQLTLQWEEDNIYDLMQAPQVLLDSVFCLEGIIVTAL